MPPPLQAPDYKYVTEECLREWKGQNAAAFRLPDPVPMSRFLYELCWAVVRGELPPQKCRAALDSVVFVEEPWQEESGSVLADIVAHLGQDITISGEYRNRLVKMTKSFVESSLIMPRLLQERCEEEFLWEVEQSKSKGQDLKAKEVRVNTRLLYQQTKFNLLREESEGYAKLVLECFELYPDNKTFYQLIPLFPKSHAAQILGFKFQYYQQLDVNSPVPSGLFRIAALLVKSGLIDLDNLYAHLLPNDDEAFEHFGSFVSRKIDERGLSNMH